MQTVTLAIGLMQLAGSFCAWLTAARTESVLLSLLCAAAGIVNGIAGTITVLEALFGKDGHIPEE